MVVTIKASTGGDPRPLSGGQESVVGGPLVWQGGSGAAGGRGEKFRRRESRVASDSSCQEKQAALLGGA